MGYPSESSLFGVVDAHLGEKSLLFLLDPISEFGDGSSQPVSTFFIPDSQHPKHRGVLLPPSGCVDGECGGGVPIVLLWG